MCAHVVSAHARLFELSEFAHRCTGNSRTHTHMMRICMAVYVCGAHLLIMRCLKRIYVHAHVRRYRRCNGQSGRILGGHRCGAQQRTAKAMYIIYVCTMCTARLCKMCTYCMCVLYVGIACAKAIAHTFDPTARVQQTPNDNGAEKMLLFYAHRRRRACVCVFGKSNPIAYAHEYTICIVYVFVYCALAMHTAVCGSFSLNLTQTTLTNARATRASLQHVYCAHTRTHTLSRIGRQRIVHACNSIV